MEERRLTYAVRDISLTVEQGEFVFLIGSSGAGKTTLLQLMSGEIAPDEGTVLLNNTNIARMLGPWRVRARRTFGVVSQQGLLIRKRTVGENLMLAAGAAGMMRRKSREAVKKALGIVGLPGVEECYPAELSIGESRRVELARAVLNSMMPSYISGFIYSALIDSFCCEQNARMTAMDSANQNAEKLLGELSLEFNRVRQAAITQEITEVSAGARAQRKNHQKNER